VFDVENSVANIPVTVNMANGNDTVEATAASQNLNALQGDLTVHGADGAGVLTCHDQNDTAAESYVVTATSIRRANMAAINYDALASVILLRVPATTASPSRAPPAARRLR